MEVTTISQHAIAVLLEIETGNHTPERCFQGLAAHYTLSVRADAVRDGNPETTAERILAHVLAHAEQVSREGYQAVAIATHAWQTWRDTMGSEVQRPFEQLVRDRGLRYVELGTERCNASFREIMDTPLAA
jgi:hypothetical protein